MTCVLESIVYRAKRGLAYGSDMASSKDVVLADILTMARAALQASKDQAARHEAALIALRGVVAALSQNALFPADAKAAAKWAQAALDMAAPMPSKTFNPPAQA